MTDFTWLFIDIQQHTQMRNMKGERSHSKFNQINNHHQWAGVSIAAYQSHHARSEQRYLSSFQPGWRGRGDGEKMKPNYLAKAEGGLIINHTTHGYWRDGWRVIHLHSPHVHMNSTKEIAQPQILFTPWFHLLFSYYFFYMCTTERHFISQLSSIPGINRIYHQITSIHHHSTCPMNTYQTHKK